MAKISSGEYTELGSYGVPTRSGGGPFTKVFITGNPRQGQTPGKIQAIYDWDSSQYLISEQDEVFWIPLFVKKIRELWVENGDRRDLEYFSWDPDIDRNYPEGAKCSYIFAGVLLDSNLSPVPDPGENQDRSAFIYFKNEGIKMGPAIEFMDHLEETAKNLDQLSDDQNFELSVVAPRRFIVKTTVGTRSSNYGDKWVFVYELHKQLPDNLVVGDKDKDGIMQKSKKWVKTFEKQFNMSELAGAPSGGRNQSQNDQVPFDFNDKSQDGQEQDAQQQNLVDKSDFSDLQLGI